MSFSTWFSKADLIVSFFDAGTQIEIWTKPSAFFFSRNVFARAFDAAFCSRASDARASRSSLESLLISVVMHSPVYIRSVRSNACSIEVVQSRHVFNAFLEWLCVLTPQRFFIFGPLRVPFIQNLCFFRRGSPFTPSCSARGFAPASGSPSSP